MFYINFKSGRLEIYFSFSRCEIQAPPLLTRVIQGLTFALGTDMLPMTIRLTDPSLWFSTDVVLSLCNNIGITHVLFMRLHLRVPRKMFEHETARLTIAKLKLMFKQHMNLMI